MHLSLQKHNRNICLDAVYTWQIKVSKFLIVLLPLSVLYAEQLIIINGNLLKTLLKILHCALSSILDYYYYYFLHSRSTSDIQSHHILARARIHINKAQHVCKYVFASSRSHTYNTIHILRIVYKLYMCKRAYSIRLFCACDLVENSNSTNTHKKYESAQKMKKKEYTTKTKT